MKETTLFSSVLRTSRATSDIPAISTREALRLGLNGGAYTVQTVSNGGYASDAAAAKFAKTVARESYGEKDKRIYGYVYLGSGGSYQTIKEVERLSEARHHPAERDEAACTIRGLIERVTLLPGADPGEMSATLHGEFGAIMEWAS